MVLPLSMNAGRAREKDFSIMPSVDQLAQRLSDEIAAAMERLHSLRTEATQVFSHDQDQRFKCFVALANRIRAILQPRIEALTEVNVFKDAKRSLGLERQGPEGRGLHEETITLSVPYSEECPASVVLSFRVGHDGPIENAIINYGSMTGWWNSLEPTWTCTSQTNTRSRAWRRTP